ncbi:hypothetical protein UB23_21535 [Pseudomonas sp. ES3-33]|nr:hypothetical protein UB23_21535 [Pseudomonas sp. ES3-33]
MPAKDFKPTEIMAFIANFLLNECPQPRVIPFLELAYKQYRRALRLVLSALSMFNLNVHSS